MHNNHYPILMFGVTALVLTAIVWSKLESGTLKTLLIFAILAAFCTGSALRF